MRGIERGVERRADVHEAAVAEPLRQRLGVLARCLRRRAGAPGLAARALETVQRLRAEGVAAVYGDASHPDALRAAGVGAAATLVLTASGLRNASEIIRQARELNPDVRVLVRSSYLRERAALRAAGAEGVVAAEGEVALAMTESLLRRLGATPVRGPRGGGPA